MNLRHFVSVISTYPAWIIALFGLIFQVCVVTYAGGHFNQIVPRWIPDDACYYFKIAQNIRAGFGSVFSPHEPTNGYHPLWMILLTLLQFIGHPSMSAFILEVLYFSVILNIIASGLLYAFLKACGFGRYQAELGMVIYLFSPWMLFLMLTGLETSLYLACLFGFFLVAIHLVRPDTCLNFRMVLLLGVSAGLMMLARTDSVFFAAIGFLWILYRRKSTSLQFLFKAGILSVVLLAPWLIWNLIRFGTFIQNSADSMAVYVRAQMPAGMAYWAGVWDGICHRLYWAVMAPLVFHVTYEPVFVNSQGLIVVIMIVFVIWVLYQCWAHGGLICPVVVWLPAVVLMTFYFCVRTFVQPWHLAPLYIWILVLVINGISEVRQYAWMVLILGLLPLSIYSINQGYFSPQNGVIDKARQLFSDAQAPLRIGITDAGYYGCFSRHEIVNLDGLVNKRAHDAIIAGCFSEYLKNIGCYEVLMHEYRLKYLDRNMRYRTNPESINLSQGRVLAEICNILLVGRFPYQERVLALNNGLVPGRLHVIEIRYKVIGNAKPYVIVTVNNRPPLIHDPMPATSAMSTIYIPLVVLQTTPKAELVLRNWSDKGEFVIESTRLVESTEVLVSLLSQVHGVGM